ncbi:MAG: hypothetical protein QOH97_1262 [Actinoplanes sp.]|jgi:alpha-ketoglutarate-dependent taurine dioxygenase|nr:hypothetical protein [Actinoplanes sp.]
MTVPTITGFELGAIREQLTQSGYSYASGLPAGFDYPDALAAFGTPVPQYGGALVRDVKPDPDIGNDVVSSLNTAGLTPHTEWYEFAGLPPRYVALWCVVPADGPGGETTLADGYALLEKFTQADRRQMSREVHTWRSPPTLTREGIHQRVDHSIIEMHNEQTVLRFSTLDLLANGELSTRYVARGREFFTKNHVAIKIERDAILIWDNWRTIHARNSFSDRRRHLRRMLLNSTE